MRKSTIPFIVLALALTGCFSEEDQPQEPLPVRGLKTVLIEDNKSSTLRKYPGVLQPVDISTLAFEIAGRINSLDLTVGQVVEKDQILITLDDEALKIDIDNSKAAVSQATVAADNATKNLERQTELKKRGTISQVTLDQAIEDNASKQQSLVQAKKSLEAAEDNLSKATIKAPFDGIISSIEAQEFETVGVGNPVATIYSNSKFEVAFTVNFDTINRLTVGKQAKVRLADDPDVVLPAIVTELGSRADSVAAFPVVVSLSETVPTIKAGMAVEVSIEFDLGNRVGYDIPLSAAILDLPETEVKGTEANRRAAVYIFDEATSTVKRRDVTIGGVRENSLLVVDGLQPGDRVASAGVTFLNDGQKVKLLADK